jgi:Cu(I)/Ag(I) efflux system membrane fusion protein
MNRKNASILAIFILLAAAVAGWRLWPGRVAQNPQAGKTVAAKQLWTCTMHPFIIRDQPGKCPVCGMDLVLKIDSNAGSKRGVNPQASALPSGVSISRNQRVMANVTTAVVAAESLFRELEATGVVQYDQTKQSKITAWIACRIDRLYAGAAGSVVTRNTPIAEVYAPDLVAAQQEYLLALRSRASLRSSGVAGIADTGDELARSARERLKLFGVTEAQIAGLERGGKPLTRMPIYPEFSGVVIEKMVQQGQYVNAGEPLFSIADLSNVWVEIEVYENELRDIKAGQDVEIRTQAYPGKLFKGKVSLVYPYLDPKTRTVRVRVAVPNPGAKLKPDMFVSASIKEALGEGIAIPVTSLMDTGKRQIVWVEVSPDSFEARQVTVGARIGERIQIVSGLSPGDKVVTTGGYLIDSESQLSSGK